MAIAAPMPRDAPVTKAMWPVRSSLTVMIEVLLVAGRDELIPIQLRQPLRLGDVIHGVGIEERIEWRGWPRHRCEAVARGPAIDLSDVFDHQCVEKSLPLRNAPYSKNRMRPPAG